MPRSNRRQGRSSGRQNNPQSWESRGGGFEQTGTGYRYDDQQGQYGPESRGWGSRNWPGQEQSREPWERSRHSEGRDYGSGYEQETRFGRGGSEGPRSFGQGRWSSEGSSQSYRGFGGGQGWNQQERERDWDRGDESRYGRGSEGYGFGSEDSEGEYEGYEPRQRSTGRGWGGSSIGEQSRFGQQGRMRDFGIAGQSGERRGQQSFAGRGPQGYKRSDERISEDINEDLTQDPELDASNITVEVHDGEVTLRGTVSDRQAKRRAEDLAESCSGVKEVQNQLRVKREEGTESESKREKGDDKQHRSPRQQIAS